MSDITIDDHASRSLFSEQEIAARIEILAAEITTRKPKRLLVVPAGPASFSPPI